MAVVAKNFAGVPENDVKMMVRDNVVNYFHLDAK